MTSQHTVPAHRQVLCMSAGDLEAHGQLHDVMLVDDGIRLRDRVLVEDDATAIGCPEGGENRSTIKGVKKWSANCEKCFGYWTKMRADCAICMRVCPYNKDYSKWHWRLFRDVLNSRFRKLALWLDDKLKLETRKPPREWWGDAPEEK